MEQPERHGQDGPCELLTWRSVRSKGDGAKIATVQSLPRSFGKLQFEWSENSGQERR